MPRKPGRPKEKNRKHLHVMVLPSTDKYLRGAVDKSKKTVNTVGKIVDGMATFFGSYKKGAK